MARIRSTDAQLLRQDTANMPLRARQTSFATPPGQHSSQARANEQPTPTYSIMRNVTHAGAA